MKKLIYVFCALGFMATISCSSDDNSPLPEQPTTAIYQGTWKMVTGISIQGGVTNTEDLREGNCDYDFYSFNSNGSKDEVYHDPDTNCTTENYTGTWNYNFEDNTITTIDTDDNYKRVLEVIEISTSTMKLKLINEDDMNPSDFGIEIFMVLEK